MRSLRAGILAFVLVATLLTGCDTVARRAELTATRSGPRPTAVRNGPRPTAAAVDSAHFAAWFRRLPPRRRQIVLRYLRAVALHIYLDALWHARYDIPPDLIPVANCVKGIESGNYAEASHPGSGSGAYQYVPGTWQTWFGRWAAAVGYTGPSYRYAYEAPWYVQDAVFVFTVRNGGAHNWDPRYGPDPCTVGLP